MSAHIEEPAPAPAPRRAPLAGKIAAGLAALVLMTFGAASLIDKAGGSDATAATTPVTQVAAPSTQAVPGTAGSTPPGMGTEVTGATLSKLEAAVADDYPGTVERAMQLPDGSYVVHVIATDGGSEAHVLVSSAFKVTGEETGGPGGPPSGMQGQIPPSGQNVPPSSGASSSGAPTTTS